jgi:hypothetical protein
MSTKERQEYQAALRELLGGRSVAYYPSLARKVGGVKAAVMICQLLYWNGDATVQKNDGWFYKSIEDMEKETGLTKVEQQTARKELESIGVIEIKLKGIPRVWYYRVDWDTLTDLLIGKETHPMGNPPNDEPESVPMSGEKPAQLNKVLKTTTEIKEQNTTTNAGKCIDAAQAETIYRKVTEFMSIPSLSREEATRMICDIALVKGDGTVDYLKRFYLAWIDPKRKQRDGRPYSKTGCGWLDWASVDTIPEIAVEAPRPQPPSKPTAKPTAVDQRRQDLEEAKRRLANGQPI